VQVELVKLSNMKNKRDFIQGKHYYLEGERVIFTALFHSQRGQCCGNGCRHCPYNPKHKKGNKILAKEFGHLKEKS
jgi:Family of unknown function (DUF5522)